MKSTRRITDTSAEVPKSGLGALFAASPVGILAQEARGQVELAKSSQLPAKGLKELLPILKAAGGKDVGETKGDPMFHDVVLPPGWRVVPTNHSMWSDLKDANGYKRAAIFYKAAFYDRDAHISAERRLHAEYGCVDFDETPKVYYPVITASGVEVWRGDKVVEETDAERKECYRKNLPTALDRCRKIAGEELVKAFPDTSMTAYFDLTVEQIKEKLPASLWVSEPEVGEEYKFYARYYSRREVDRFSSFGRDDCIGVLDGYDGYNAFLKFKEKRQPRYEWTVADEGHFKDKKFPNDKAAMAYAEKHRERLSNGYGVDITVTCGKREVGVAAFNR